MRASGIVPKQVINQFTIKARQIVSQESSVPDQKFFVQRSIESFNAGIHFWCSRIGMEMRDPEIHARFMEVSGKFAAIVGLHRHEGKWSYTILTLVKKSAAVAEE